MNQSRWEYIKQPHIIILIIVGVLAIAGATFTAFNRLKEMNHRSSMPTQEACQDFIDDEHLCRFAAISENLDPGSYRSITTATNSSGTEITITDIESPDRMSSITKINETEVEAFVMIDADNYIRDYSDDTWAKLTDGSFEPTSDTDAQIDAYDFSNETSSDVIEFRDQYKSLGQEPCGEQICFKYQIDTPDSEVVTFIWFDTEEYLIRRYQTSDADTATNTQLSYEEVTITAPSPVKEVTEEEFNALLE